MSRAKRGTLFPVQVWPPFVDALTLVLAAFVLLVLVAAAAQSGLLQRLRKSENDLLRLQADKARVERRLQALAGGLAGAVEVEDGKVIVQGEVLFASGSDELSPAGQATVARLAPGLSALLAAEPDQMILVGGHTDDVPISTARFGSNWELSSARSTSVAKQLLRLGLPANRVVASGFGEHHPRVENRDADTRRRNRRIEVLIVPLQAVSSPTQPK